MNIILNEKQYVEDMLASPGKENVNGHNIWLVARYYSGLGCDKGKIKNLLERFVIRNDPMANVVLMSELIDRASAGAGRKKLLEIESIPVTFAEMDTVDSLATSKERKVMFTLICLAKLTNEITGNTGSWVNQDAKDIFQMANTYPISKINRDLLLHKLYKQGLISFSKRVDNTNIQVKCLNYDSDPCLQVKDFRSLGNQYYRYHGGNYIECDICGIVVKRTSPRQLYCPSCAKELARLRANNKM